MTRDLALSLLAQGTNGASILQILETITEDVTQANIEDAASHFESIQF
jgi:hypothetical protein